MNFLSGFNVLGKIKKIFWSFIFFLFAAIEYNFQIIGICGSGWITGQMWFMYLCMALASFPYEQIINTKYN